MTTTANTGQQSADQKRSIADRFVNALRKARSTTWNWIVGLGRLIRRGIDFLAKFVSKVVNFISALLENILTFFWRASTRVLMGVSLILHTPSMLWSAIRTKSMSDFTETWGFYLRLWLPTRHDEDGIPTTYGFGSNIRRISFDLDLEPSKTVQESMNSTAPGDMLSGIEKVAAASGVA